MVFAAALSMLVLAPPKTLPIAYRWQADSSLVYTLSGEGQKAEITLKIGTVDANGTAKAILTVADPQAQERNANITIDRFGAIAGASVDLAGVLQPIFQLPPTTASNYRFESNYLDKKQTVKGRMTDRGVNIRFEHTYATPSGRLAIQQEFDPAVGRMLNVTGKISGRNGSGKFELTRRQP